MREQSALASSACTIINGDGNDGIDGTNARYSLDSIPVTWRGNFGSPIYRHDEGASYGFADGHVKWFPAPTIESMNPNASPATTKLTFAVS